MQEIPTRNPAVEQERAIELNALKRENAELRRKLQGMEELISSSKDLGALLGKHKIVSRWLNAIAKLEGK